MTPIYLFDTFFHSMDHLWQKAWNYHTLTVATLNKARKIQRWLKSIKVQPGIEIHLLEFSVYGFIEQITYLSKKPRHWIGIG